MTTRTRSSRTVLGLTVAVWLGVALAFLAAVAALVAWPAGAGALFGPRVAIVEIEGVIGEAGEIVGELRAFRDDPSIRAVVVRINSPGGVVAPTQEIHQALRRLREAGKPVVASLGAVAASGGYYVAVAADRIYASPGTLTGSIGVLIQLANLDALLKKVGVEFVVVKAGRHKDLGHPARALTAEERRILTRLLEDVHTQFVEAVAEGRRLDPATVRGFADGRIFSGNQARALKMVDELGSLEDAVNGAADLAGIPKPPAVLGPRRRFSILEGLLGRLGLASPLATWRLPAVKTPLSLMD